VGGFFCGLRADGMQDDVMRCKMSILTALEMDASWVVVLAYLLAFFIRSFWS
jgi:hypothetical protein